NGVILKCTFCVHRLEKDLLPSCVVTCPVDALVFGDKDDPASPISNILRERESFQLLEDLGTEPSVYYLGGVPPNSKVREIERPLTKVER
ncbi:MAG: 4Fe-4S dicluster domain-containing protein, partial [Acidimicrobiia bacterium]